MKSFYELSTQERAAALLDARFIEADSGELVERPDGDARVAELEARWRDERLAWLDGWQAGRCGTNIPEPASQGLRGAFQAGLAEARQ